MACHTTSQQHLVWVQKTQLRQAVFAFGSFGWQHQMPLVASFVYRVHHTDRECGGRCSWCPTHMWEGKEVLMCTMCLHGMKHGLTWTRREAVLMHNFTRCTQWAHKKTKQHVTYMWPACDQHVTNMHDSEYICKSESVGMNSTRDYMKRFVGEF